AVRPNRPLGSVVTVMTGAAPPAGIGAVRVQLPRLSQVHPVPAAELNAPPKLTVVAPVVAALPRFRTVALKAPGAPTTNGADGAARVTGVSTGPRRVAMRSWLVSLEWSVSQSWASCADAVRPNRPLGSVVTVMTGAAPPAGIGAVRVQLP